MKDQKDHPDDSSTFSQIFIQIVFAVKGRQSLIDPVWEERLYSYTTQIIQNKGQKVFAIGGIQDHIHIFVGMKPSCRLPDLVREIKKSTNIFVNRNNFTHHKFSWQSGYGAFSYSYSQMDHVVKYVMNQKEHHKATSFRNEYIAFLDKFEIEYDEKYLWD